MKFGLIIADPPWDHEVYSIKGKSRAAEKHYNVMPLAAICALPVADCARDDCTLFLWACAPLLPHAMAVLEAWGFRYVTMIPWLKMHRAAAPSRGIGYHAQSCFEPLIIAKRGRGSATRKEDKPLGVIFSPRGPHSAKPDEQYDWAERYDGPYLEMFARPTDGGMFPPRENWTLIGNGATGRDIREDLRLLAETEK